MLACVQHSWRVAPLVRPAAASFSSSARCWKAEQPKLNTMDELHGVLAEQSTRQPAERPKQYWEKFQRDRILAPQSLTFKARTKEAYYPRRAVAPTSREARPKDVFHQLNLDPRDFAMNAPLLYEFVSEMGKIQGRDITQLTFKSQRLLGKAIRRAKQMGIMAVLSKPDNRRHK